MSFIGGHHSLAVFSAESSCMLFLQICSPCTRKLFEAAAAELDEITVGNPPMPATTPLVIQTDAKPVDSV